MEYNDRSVEFIKCYLTVHVITTYGMFKKTKDFGVVLIYSVSKLIFYINIV